MNDVRGSRYFDYLPCFFGRNIDPDQLLGAINGWVLYGSKADIVIETRHGGRDL
jgi:hypothetical protein